MRERKQDILDAALRAFTDKGFAAATVADVRQLSGASTGSIYHHFGDKEGLAAALFLAGIRDYQAGLRGVLARETDAERGVKALVRHHLRWVAAHPDLARFILAGRPPGAAEELARLNRETFAATERWLAERGLRSLPLELIYAVLIGPAQEFCRHWLEGRAPTSMTIAERELGAAAWRALRPERQDRDG
ncbi:MAG: TetR/AcrR family transcriptional regulator [Pseudonocardiaceae bacterium]